MNKFLGVFSLKCVSYLYNILHLVSFIFMLNSFSFICTYFIFFAKLFIFLAILSCSALDMSFKDRIMNFDFLYCLSPYHLIQKFNPFLFIRKTIFILFLLCFIICFCFLVLSFFLSFAI